MKIQFKFNPFKNYFAAVASFCVIMIVLSGCSLDGNFDPRESNPAVPSQPVPANNLINADQIITLQWYAENILSYDLYLDTKNPPEAIYAEGLTSATELVFGLEQGVKYFWRVKAVDRNGVENISDVWNFTTRTEFSDFEGTIFNNNRVIAAFPNKVHLMFQTVNRNNVGITNYSLTDFELREDRLLVEPIENFVVMQDRNKINYTHKTVLMINNTADALINFTKIKSAISAFINNLPAYHQTAVYSFADDVQMVKEFTSNKGELISALNSIQPMIGTTDLYGGVIAGAERLNDVYNFNDVEQSSMVVFTTQDDTKGNYLLEDVLQSIENRKVYAIALGKNFNPFTISLIGNKNVYFVNDLDELESKFIDTYTTISKLKDSFYWLTYSSPLRDDANHTLKITAKNNIYTGSKSSLEVNYYSTGFFSVVPGLYINADASDPDGLDTVRLSASGNILLTASTFGNAVVPSYSWFVGNESVASLKVSENSLTAIVAAEGSAGETTELLVADLKNSLQKIITIIIE